MMPVCFFWRQAFGRGEAGWVWLALLLASLTVWPGVWHGEAQGKAWAFPDPLQHILQGGSRSSWLVFILSYLLVLKSFRTKPFAAGWCMSLEKTSCQGTWKDWSWSLLRMWSACALQMSILHLQLTHLLSCVYTPGSILCIYLLISLI